MSFNALIKFKMKTKIILDNEFSNKSSLSKTRFLDPLVKDWLEMDSIRECWEHCEDNNTDCKAISFYSPTRKCQLFKNDSLPQIFDPQFISFTTKKGLKLLNYWILLVTDFLKEISSILHLNKIKFGDDYYKSEKTNDVTDCWNKCENEQVCRSISFCNDDELAEEVCSIDNCFLYTNKLPEQSKKKYFISIIYKTESIQHLFFRY